MIDERSESRSRLLRGLPAAEAERADGLLAASASIEVEAGMPYFRRSFPSAALLVVEEGFVVVRASSAPPTRSIITCEAGAGFILLRPRDEEVLFGLGNARITAVSADDCVQLMALPTVAGRVLEQMAARLGQKQEAIANFGETRHVERVRRKLLQLARTYGHVARDGIRIEFPITHVVLAEMIGSSRETVTRALDALQRDGFVARRGHTYRLLVAPECLFGDQLGTTQDGRKHVWQV
jgi:CRP-like cAMP-binding protein